MLGLRGKKVCKEQEFLGILSSFVWEFSPWLCLHNRLGIPSSTKPHPSKGSVPNRCKAGGRWRKASKQQALLAPNRHIMEGNSTTYMYICFKIRGEVWKNCKSWERNQDCTEEVSRQPARYHLQETLGASHHLLQEKRHPGTQESRDPGINGSTSPLPVIIQLQIHHLGSVSNQGATAPAADCREQSNLAARWPSVCSGEEGQQREGEPRHGGFEKPKFTSLEG